MARGETQSGLSRWSGSGRLALAALAGAALVEGARVASFASPAEAQRSGTSGILNPADQRNEMIKELRKLNDHLGAIRKTVGSEAFDVNVLSMPSGTTVSGD